MDSIQKLTRKDGTVYENSRALESSDLLYVYVKDGSDIRDVGLNFLDPEKVQEIKFTYSDAEIIFRGYTKVTLLKDEGTFISVILKKEDSNGQDVS